LSYVLKKPTRMRADPDAAGAGHDTASVATGPVANSDDGPAVAATDSARRGRADAVKEAFVAMYGRLEGLLGDRWTGAHERLHALFPETSAELEAAETRADDLAIAYIDGCAAEAAFATALAEYEQLHTLAARLLAAQDRADERRCVDCGRPELTVVVCDEQGQLHCRACLNGA
jgi:hypothetical protein